MAKYCPNCGYEMKDEHRVCANCGMPYQDHIEEMNVQSYTQPPNYNQPNYQQPMNYSNPNYQQPYYGYYQQPVVEQNVGVGWVILAVLIPIVGWIFCGIWSSTKPKTAKAMGIAATISFICNLIISFFLPILALFFE